MGVRRTRLKSRASRYGYAHPSAHAAEVAHELESHYLSILSHIEKGRPHSEAAFALSI